MHLQNEFELDTRLIFADLWECWQCGENGTRTGGLELHHVTGRDSNSTLNGSVLCKTCHNHIGHSDEEQSRYLLKTIKLLVKLEYQFTEYDISFYNKYKRLYERIHA